jgi:hypothetical protein
MGTEPRDIRSAGGSDHKDQEVSLRGLVIFASVVVGALVVAGVVGLLMVRGFERRAERHEEKPSPLAVEMGPRLPPEPRLQANPDADLARMRAAEDSVLQAWGWVDRQAGVVRMPVEKAAELVVREGLPRFAPAAPAAAPASGVEPHR